MSKNLDLFKLETVNEAKHNTGSMTLNITPTKQFDGKEVAILLQDSQVY